LHEETEQKENKPFLNPGIKRTFLFCFKFLVFTFSLAFLLIVYSIVTGERPDFLDYQTLKDYLNYASNLTIFIGAGLLLILLNPFQKSSVVVTAGRYRAPNQTRYADEIIKRNVSDWHRTWGTLLGIVIGILLSTVH